MASVEYQLHKSATAAQPYWWRIVSTGNGRVLATGETYYNRSDAINAANLVRQGSQGAGFTDHTGER